MSRSLFHVWVIVSDAKTVHPLYCISRYIDINSKIHLCIMGNIKACRSTVRGYSKITYGGEKLAKKMTENGGGGDSQRVIPLPKKLLF